MYGGVGMNLSDDGLDIVVIVCYYFSEVQRMMDESDESSSSSISIAVFTDSGEVRDSRRVYF